MDVITYPFWDLGWFMLVNVAPGNEDINIDGFLDGF